MSIAEDIKFAQESGEFSSTAPMLRYVAALNPQATRQEFVEACVAAGFRANSSGNRFYESRCFDRDNNGMLFDKEGRFHETDHYA